MKFSIVNFNDIDQDLLRLEAEYYLPEYLENEKRFTEHPQLNAVAERIVCGPFGATIPDETYSEDGIKLIRPFNIKNYQIEKSNIVRIPYYYLEEKQLKTFTTGAIFFSRVGDVKCGIYVGDEHTTISPNIIAVEVKDSTYNPYFLTLFFNSRYGYLQIKRELKIVAQPTISTTGLHKFRLPFSSMEFQKFIASKFMESINLTEISDLRYSQAESLLLGELGLADWQPKRQLTFVKSYADVRQAERFDADYFQPQYDEIVSAITSYPGGSDILGALTELKSANFAPEAHIEYEYIELANIADNGEVSGSTVDIGANLPSRARRQVKAGDVIVSSIEGSLSSIALIPDSYNNALCSTGFHVVKSEKLNSATLLVLLRSVVGQMQLKKGCKGTILTAISGLEFEKLVLPKLSEKIQTEIQRKVAESFELRKQSKRLLEDAKRAVEIAIETDEQAAIAWLADKTEL